MFRFSTTSTGLENFMIDCETVGGKAFFVGGFVRDPFLGRTSKDRDVEVFGLKQEHLEIMMRRHGTFKSTIVDGTGVFKFRPFDSDSDVDVSLPRRERSTGESDNEFEFESDHTMTLEEAASRRDFTMNAIFKTVNGDILDPFDGIGAINNRIIRHVSDRFVESPVRVLRAMQFASRFDMPVSLPTVRLSKTMSIETIAVERIFTEFDKMLTHGVRPSRGLNFLRATWIHHFPVLHDLIGCEQEFSHHPEGDVFVHTCMVVNKMAEICTRDNVPEDRRRILMFAALLHDIGKPSTTKVIDGKITSHGHDDVGADMARVFLTDLRAPNELIDAVEILVREHMALIRVPANNTRAVRRLVRRLGPVSIEDWARLVEADASGRSPKPASAPGAPFVETARSMNIQTKINDDILMGRHLIEMGMKPGPQFKIILNEAREAQDNEEFTDVDGAIVWFNNRKANNNG